jgi:SnoaL-like protein
LSLADKQACAEVVQTWGLARDRGRWDELLATFTQDGEIAVSWFRGPFTEFVERCRQSFASGVRSKHLIWPSVVRVKENRALAETNIAILVRQSIDGVLVDLTSYGRFYDRMERRERWMICERAAIYEQDRLDPVEPSASFDSMMQKADASQFPAPYRYMAFRVLAAGRALASPIHYDGSAETDALYARYAAWLSENKDSE